MNLSIRNLQLAHGKRVVIADLSLPPIPAGSLVAVLGPNGVGKSTLIRALAGMHMAQGEATFGAANLLGVAPWRQTARVGYLPQHLPQASSLLAYELLQGACRIRDLPGRLSVEQRIAEVLARLGIENLALRRLDELSGGQRQLIGLAQVLVGDPGLLLLDEPTSALDLRWQLRVLQTVGELTRGQRIALIACHDLNLALRHCNLLLLLAPDGEYRLGRAEDVLDVRWLRHAYGIEARIERCSQGFPLVLADRAVVGCEV